MRISLILLSVLLASCSDFSMPSMPSVASVPLLNPYKMDIRQGNYITPEMREKLKFGMSKSQVRYVMGTPMISDAFHGNRWDYVYRFEHHGEIVEKQNLTLHFDGDNLVRIDDGKTVQTAPVIVQQAVVPAVAEPAVSEPVTKVDPKADVLKSVQGWAVAWSAKNTRDYLAAYKPDYKPQGMSRDAWEKQRLERISKPKVIEVELSEVSVSVSDDSHASVSFSQRYRSDLYRDNTRKTLQLEKFGNAWLIVSEQAAK